MTISLYADITHSTVAGEYGAMLDEAERLQELFYDALVSAGENYKDAGGKMKVDNTNPTADPYIRYSRRLTEDDLQDYLKAGTRANKAKLQALKDGKKIILLTEDEISDFISASINGNQNLTTVAYGRVNDRLAADVEEYSEGDIIIDDNFLELVPYDIDHAYKEHLKAKEEGDIDLTEEDFKNIPEYIDHYDELVYAIRFKSGNTRICLSKRLANGRVLLIETVSKSRGSVEFKNMIGVSNEKYVNDYENVYKKRNSTNTRGSKSSNISLHDETVSNNSINEEEKIVKNNSDILRSERLSTEKAEDINLSPRDSEGNTLTEVQQEYFKDSVVRDAEGNLIVCYHGTDAYFNTFDPNFISQDNKLGYGFYFLAGKELQYSYKHPKKAYLNITNPITDTSKIISKKALTEFCNKLGIEFEYDSNDYDLDVYERLSYSYTGEVKQFLENVVDILGIDGVISEERNTAVIFNSNQAKLTTNTNPTNDADIRYSERFNQHSVETALWDAMSHKDEGYDNLILVSTMPDYIVDKLGIEGDFYIYRDHAYENMVSKEDAEKAGRPTKRGRENIHFHNLGIEKMSRAILSINNPIMTISTKTKDGNPAVIMLLNECGQNKAPLYAVLSFYANKGINGDWSQRPHIVLTIAERNYTEKDGGRVGYDEIIKNAIKEGRVLDFDEKKRDDLSVIANTAGIGNITRSSLTKNIAYFKKEVKAFKEKNNILYSERNPDSVSNRSLLANALDSAVQNDIEKNKLKQYKEKIDFINAEERKLADLNRQLKELRFSKGKRDTIKTKQINDLQAEATKTANRISIYDKQLLNLEVSTALKNVLEREKAKARKKQKQRDAEILQEQKDKANATIREIMNRHTESRKKATESRHKTVVRNKIKRVIKDLNSVFNKGTKERNVKIGLREPVRKALEAAGVLFSDEITNEDIVRLGVDSVSAEEQEKLERYANLLAMRETKEDAAEISRINSKISKLNSELKDVFIRERTRLNKENVSTALDSLAEAYVSLQNSDDDYMRKHNITAK